MARNVLEVVVGREISWYVFIVAVFSVFIRGIPLYGYEFQYDWEVTNLFRFMKITIFF